VAIARGAKITRDPALTTTYLNLGMVYGAGLTDRIRAIQYFTAALPHRRPCEPSSDSSEPGAGGDVRSRQAERGDARTADGSVGLSPHASRRGSRGASDPHPRAGGHARREAGRALLPRVGSAEFRQIPMRETRPGLFVGLIPKDMVQARASTTTSRARTGPGSASTVMDGTSPNVVSVKGGAPKRRGKVLSIAVMVGTGGAIVNGGSSEHGQPQVLGSDRPVDIKPGVAPALFHIARS